MKRREAIKLQAKNIVENVCDVGGFNKYDLIDVATNMAKWADRTMIEKVINLVDSVRLDYYAEHTDELIDKIKRLIDE